MKTISFLMLGSFTIGAAIAAHAHEELEIVVGRNAAGQIQIHTHFSQPVKLPVSIFSGISGFAIGELALHSTVLDEPEEDFFQLSPAADFRMILLAKDPGMEIWAGTNFMAVGESYFVGASPFDAHPIWNIPAGIQGSTYSVTFKLVDTNSLYTESAPFILSFTPEKLATIQVAPLASQQLVLSWPTNMTGWELQSGSQVHSTNWTEVTNAPIIIGTNFSVSITPSESQQFFRLERHDSHH